MINLRQFIGYDVIDTVNGKTGNYKLEAKNYDSVFGYASNPKDGEVKTLLDYIKIFVSDKTDENNNIKGLQDTIANINSSLTKLENDLKECAKSSDLSKYVESTNLTSQLKNYATKTDLNGLASDSDVTTIKDNLANNYYDKTEVDSKLTTASSGMVKFDNSPSTYDFSTLENNGLIDIILNFDESYQKNVKFVKVNGTAYPVISSGNFNNDSNKIPNGSLIQIGYMNGGKLCITEPVWVECQNAFTGVSLFHSI